MVSNFIRIIACVIVFYACFFESKIYRERRLLYLVIVLESIAGIIKSNGY